jgi:hypothetical protein
MSKIGVDGCEFWGRFLCGCQDFVRLVTITLDSISTRFLLHYLEARKGLK